MVDQSEIVAVSLIRVWSRRVWFWVCLAFMQWGGSSLSFWILQAFAFGWNWMVLDDGWGRCFLSFSTLHLVWLYLALGRCSFMLNVDGGWSSASAVRYFVEWNCEEGGGGCAKGSNYDFPSIIAANWTWPPFCILKEVLPFFLDLLAGCIENRFV